MKKKDKVRPGRRDFLKLGAGAGAVMSMVKSGTAFAQGVPAWEARPANIASVRPVSIDMHTHWAPEAYVKAQVEMGRPAPANPNPLDFDLDKRRKWMDEHGIQMHVLTLSGGMPWQWATPEQGVRLARIVNDAAIEAHGQIAVSGRAAQGDLHQHIPAADAIGVRRQGGDRDSRRSIVVVGARSAQPRGKRCSKQRNETQTHRS